MEISHITSQSLRRLLNLTEQKDRLVALVEELEKEISKVFSGVAVPAAKRPVKKIVSGRKAGKRTPEKPIAAPDSKPAKPASKKSFKSPKISKGKTK